MEPRTCPHCAETFYDMKPRVFSNHVRWCHKNPKRNNTENIKESVIESYDKRNGKVKKFKVECHKCSKEFQVEEREKQFPKKEKYFCSRSCANSRDRSEEVKNKISESLKKEPIKKECPFCSNVFETNRKDKKYCSKYCSIESRKKYNRKSLRSYRGRCKFTFDVYEYKNEFNLKLLERYGEYSPVNGKDNLGGVSKDHMVSVKYGFDNNIDPKILSHPANCRLMVHSDNISKNYNCSITYEELLQRIEKWNIKYNMG